MKTVCGKFIGGGRICTLHPDHQIPCSGNAPTTPEKHEFEDAMLVFQFGMAFSQYDPRYLRSPNHCNEAVEFHAVRLGLMLKDEQLEMLKETVKRHFNA